MKIIHCIFSFNTGGAETMLIDIVNEQVKTEEVSLIIVNDSYEQSLIEQLDGRIKVVCLNRKSSLFSFLPLIKLNWLLFSLHPDVIHVHSVSLLSVILPWIGRRLFYTVHALNIYTKYSGRVTCMFAISDAVKEDMSNRCICPIVTIPNGIVTEKIAKRLHRPFVNQMRIVQVARLDADKKGQDILIHALAILKKKGLSNILLDFIGEGASHAFLLQLAEKLGVKNQVHFLGLRSREYVYSHLKDYDVLCHPARYEGFGLTVAEGMVAGLPLLVSNEGGPYEIIKKGELGYAFKKEDADDCAAKLEYIYNNYLLALEPIDKARNYVVENYSATRMVQSYLQEYNKRIK